MTRTQRRPFVGLVLSALMMLGLSVTGGAPAAAEVSELQGSAYGAFVKVGLFGGPPSQVGAAPMVELPASGGNVTDSLPQLSAQFGPAIIFGGVWPDGAASAPPSGPLSVRTEGNTGPGGFVTSSVDIGRHPTPLEVRCSEGAQPPCYAPGGIGPGPVIAEVVHSECRADESGLSGFARFEKGKVETSIDVETQLANSHVDMPELPAPNTAIEGTLDHVGDRYRVVLNEQIIEGDTITVRAAHTYLLGNIAVGDSIVGQVTCGLSADKVSTAPPTTVARPGATTSSVPPTTVGATDEAAGAANVSDDDDGGGGGALVAGGLGAVAVLGLAGFLAYRRQQRRPADASAADSPGSDTAAGPG